MCVVGCCVVCVSGGAATPHPPPLGAVGGGGRMALPVTPVQPRSTMLSMLNSMMSFSGFMVVPPCLCLFLFFVCFFIIVIKMFGC